MSPNDTFTITSIGAPLVEVRGDGPHQDCPHGLTVSDGVPTIAPVAAHYATVRRWRVVGPRSVRATVSVTSTPLLAYVGVRRRIPGKWPRLTEILRRLRLVRSDWQDIDDGARIRVTAEGGDLIVVTFLDR